MSDPSNTPDAEHKEYLGPQDAEICEYAGHEWAPAGGGLEICMRCEGERWEDEPE